MFRKDSFTNRNIFVRYVENESSSEQTIKLLFEKYRLWAHEVMRVFYDRLINEEDREWLFNEIRKIVSTNFKESFDKVFQNLSKSTVRYCETKLN